MLLHPPSRRYLPGYQELRLAGADWLPDSEVVRRSGDLELLGEVASAEPVLVRDRQRGLDEGTGLESLGCAEVTGLADFVDALEGFG